jgi:riboflavin biosynthesis pyrimidine reductase
MPEMSLSFIMSVQSMLSLHGQCLISANSAYSNIAFFPCFYAFEFPRIGSDRRNPKSHLALESSTRCSDSSDFPPPIVTLKIALDLNGAVDDLDAAAKRFTSPETLDAVHRLRRHCSAVLVGVGTIIRDDPSLTVRRVPLHPAPRQPTRIVLDPTLRLLRELPSAAVLSDGLDTLLLCTEPALASALALGAALFRPVADAQLAGGCGAAAVLARHGAVEVAGLADRGGRLDLRAVLAAAARRGMGEVMVEGGPATARGFLDAGLVDRAGAAPHAAARRRRQTAEAGGRRGRRVMWAGLWVCARLRARVYLRVRGG